MEPKDDYQRRVDLLISRLPPSLQDYVQWLQKPSSRVVRIPAGVLLILSGFLWFLPVLGLWMLPLGMLLLAQDVPFMRRLVDRLLAWIERKHPSWLGLPS
jgi:hypothetical protein